jgi:hypothetical protein
MIAHNESSDFFGGENSPFCCLKNSPKQHCQRKLNFFFKKKTSSHFKDESEWPRLLVDLGRFSFAIFGY